MRIVKWFVLVVLFSAVGVPLLLLFSALQDQPLVARDSYPLTQANVARIKVALREANPRWLEVGESKTVRLVEEDLNLMLNYGLARFVPGAVRVDLEPASAALNLSLKPGRPLAGKHLNFRIRLVQRAGHIGFTDWYFGDLAIPDSISRLVSVAGHKLLLRTEQYQAALAALEELRIGRGQVQVSYNWKQALKDQIRNTGRQLLFAEHEQQRLQFYHERIFLLSRTANRHASLTQMLAPLFDAAARRSSNEAQAVAENRALLLALTFHILRMDLGYFVAQPVQPLRFYWLFWPTLEGRRDLAQHFIVSSGIAALAGNSIAQAAGLFKELKDSQGGSGFSFADLAADLAGTRFAEVALSTGSALALQELMRKNMSETAYMPAIDALPEGMQAVEFTARYENMDNAAYRRVSLEIEKRINRCAAYQI